MVFALVLVTENEEKQKDPSENLAEAVPKEPPPIRQNQEDFKSATFVGKCRVSGGTSSSRS
jgi:hypothetical protein